VRSALEDRLEVQLAEAYQPMQTGAPMWEREYRFHPTRKWRFDFAWPSRKLAVEIEGGTWVRGRHGSGVGVYNDAEKYNEAALLGWTLLRVTSNMVKDGEALEWIRRGLEATA
jgi:very-short-patch-repair endonuclease